ncbi:MAG: HAMP domain-containing protein [Phycisphaerae bacterium]|nr:HAMP domain-containing protein [Phycisphaerae bacterium]
MAIRHKLIAAIMMTCTVALTLAGGVFVGYQYVDARQAMVKTLQTQAQMIAEAAVQFEASRDAEDVLGAFHAQPSVFYACIHNAKGELLAEYTRPGARIERPLPRNEGSEPYTFTDTSLTVTKPILLQGEPVGRVCVWSDLVPVRDLFRRNLVTVAYVLIGALLAATLVSYGIQGVISTPILGLAAVAKTVSERREYSTRAARHGNDEIGHLIDSFNEMLDQIQQRDAALLSANEQLETRVRERTSELSRTNEQLKVEIAQRVKAEEALEQANRDLQGTVRALQRSNQELQELTAITAHDLKAPLRAIGTLSDWLCGDYRGKLDRQAQEYLQRIKGRVSRMNRLIDSILLYSEIGRGQRTVQRVCLQDLVCKTLSTLDRPPQVQVVVENGLPTVLGEEALLTQVFRHLVGNAIQYLGKTEGRIAIGCEEDGAYWRFHVTDNGPGIDAKYHERIFKVFQTLAPRDRAESTGIGLAVVKKIIELYSGTVWVESSVGQGSTFFFTLPRLANSEDQAQAEESRQGSMSHV